MRVVEQRAAERILQRRLLVAQRARLQPRQRVDNYHRGQFPAADHIVAQRPFLVDALDEPLVGAFVASRALSMKE